MGMQWLTDFFMDESEIANELRLFDWPHILLLAATAGVALCLFLFREPLRCWKHRETLRYWMAGLFLFNMLTFYGVFVVKGIYDWRIHLPFHFCFISGFLFMAVLVTGNRRWFRAVYFFTWAGPLPAMIWPNTPIRFDRYLSYQFVISHHLLLLMGLYCLIVLEYRVERRDPLRGLFWGNGIFAAVFAFNQISGTNYIMTTELPEHVRELFPFLQQIGHPILWLELCALAAMLLACIPVWLLGRLDRGKCPQSRERAAAS
ncbi:MAG: YwaF family protein [Clostridiales bacterium]|nr:YwaF family protein [Clostridiales bacterium]